MTAGPALVVRSDRLVYQMYNRAEVIILFQEKPSHVCPIATKFSPAIYITPNIVMKAYAKVMLLGIDTTEWPPAVFT